MKNPLLNKLKDSFFSVIPIAIFVVILCGTITPIGIWELIRFLFCVLLIMFGMALFSLGAEVAMIPIGQKMGATIAKSGKMWFLLLCAFILGAIITMAEPDLNVLAEQVSSVDKMFLIAVISVGVGLFLMLSILRNKFKISLALILSISYSIVLILAFIIPEHFVPLSFDSGSVTTGAMSVPFILAFGIGIASIKGSAKSEDESFGMIALSSVGPIIAVMLIGAFLAPNSVDKIVYDDVQVFSFQDIFINFLNTLPIYLKEVAVVLLPIVLIFLLFQIFKLKLDKKSLWNIFVGLFYAYFGICLFLTAVNFGFLPVGNALGSALANLDFNWIAIPIMFVLGYIIILAEPAVYVLTKQIAVATSGMIKGKNVKVAMCVGVAIALAIVTMRILLKINLLWFIVPIYILCIVLSFIVPPVFTGIAFDSGGVVTGAMASTFVLPLIIGFVVALNHSIMLEAFGTLALIASIPILILLLLGLFYKIILNRTAPNVAKRKRKVEIVEFDR